MAKKRKGVESKTTISEDKRIKAAEKERKKRDNAVATYRTVSSVFVNDKSED